MIQEILQEVESLIKEIADICSKLVQFPTPAPRGYTDKIVD